MENKEIGINLPILFEGVNEYKYLPFDFDNMFSEFRCIFDGAALGQYLFGIDKFITKQNTVGFVNESCVFDPSNFEYKFIDQCPYLISNGIKYKIVNLHMHCKNIAQLL
jgi:hypothetical protein